MRILAILVGLQLTSCGDRVVGPAPDSGTVTDAGTDAAGDSGTATDAGTVTDTDAGTDSSTDAGAATIVARFDATGATPWPSDAQRDTSGLRVPEDTGTPTERELAGWLNTLDAWPADVPARARFSGPIDSSTIQTNVRAFFVGGSGSGNATVTVPVTATVTDSATALDIRAKWQPAATHLLALTDGLRGAGGERVVEDTGFPAERERLRAMLIAAGLDPERVVLAWTFTTSDAPAVIFAPEEGEGPFPSDLLREPATGALRLPIDAGEPEVLRRLHERLTTLDGFSTTAAARLRATAPIATPAAGAAAFLRAGARTPASAHVRADVLRATPDTPLADDALHAFVASGLRAADGRLLRRGYRQQLLLMRESVADQPGGAEHEAQRGRLRPLLDHAGAPARDALQVAMPFTTARIAAPLADTLGSAAAAGLDAAPVDVTQAEKPLTHLNTARVLHGYVRSADRLDPVTKAFRADGAWTESRVPFLLCVPNGEGPFRAAIFGHGLNTAKEFLHFVCDHLAAKGIATVSIDMPYHGERTHCLYDAHCEFGAQCRDDGACERAGVPAQLATALGTPTATGAAYFALDDLWKTREHFLQSFADLGALYRSLTSARAAWPVALAGAPPRYVGQSLGGILGATFTAGEARIDAAVLNVAGAGIVALMEESPTFRTGYRALLDYQGISPGTALWDAYEDAAMWALDLPDPLNHAARVTGRALIQMAINDQVVPNSTTLRLHQLSGAPREDYAGTHGFLANPSELAYLPAVRSVSEYLAR